MIFTYILGQTFGVIGACIAVARPQFKRKEQMMLCNVLVNIMSMSLIAGEDTCIWPSFSKKMSASFGFLED